MFEGLYNSPQKVGSLISVPEIPILLWNRDSPVTTASTTYELVRIGSASKDAIATPSADWSNQLYTFSSSLYYPIEMKFSLEATFKSSDAAGEVNVALVNAVTGAIIVEFNKFCAEYVTTTRSDAINIKDIDYDFTVHTVLYLGVGFSSSAGDTASLYQARLIIYPSGSRI